VTIDFRHALRALRLDWRFTLTLVSTLATGIAASGVIFNVVNASLLRPLPIPDEERVHRLQDYTLNPGAQRVLRTNRIPNFLSIRDEARSFEFGIRQAVGATRRHIISLVLRDGATLVVLGLVAGAGLSLVVVRALQTVMSETSTPPLLPALVCAVLVAATLAAALTASRRATRVSPVEVMRSE
jgi:hypothetical protein